jgi:PAS domain S-box-containing protein
VALKEITVADALDGAGLGYWQLHMPSGEFTCNAICSQLCGLPQDMSATGFWSLAGTIRDGDRHAVVTKRERLLAGDIDSYSLIFRVPHANDRCVTLQEHARILARDEEGRPTRIVGVQTNISREKELERRLNAVFNRPFQYVGILSPDGTVLETNRTAVQDSGYNLEDVLNKPFWKGPSFARSPQVQQQLKDAVAKARSGEAARFEVTRSDTHGVQKTLDFTITPVLDEDGRVVNLIPEGRDITELVKTREALRAIEERLNTASEAGNVGVWDSRPQNDERWFNSQWWTMLGYLPGEMPSTLESLHELLHENDRPAVFDQLIKIREGSSKSFDMEYRMRCKDGRWRWINGKGRTVESSGDGKALRITGVHIDVTERREAEKRLETADRLESIGRLASGVAHEINTPVQYVNDSLYFIREATLELLAHADAPDSRSASNQAEPLDLEYLKDNLPSALERAADGLARVAEIVKSMKEFSRADQDAAAPFELNRAIQNTLVVARSEYKYVADLQTDLGDVPLITCHGGQINQVVLNLVVNAAHAIADVVAGSQDKGIITVKTYLDGPDVVISVGDTGAGIPEVVQPHIFEQFFTTKHVGRGTGQGLSLAHHIVVQGHGGSITFQTEVGAGTTFFVRLPLASAVDHVERAA